MCQNATSPYYDLFSYLGHLMWAGSQNVEDIWTLKIVALTKQWYTSETASFGKANIL